MFLSKKTIDKLGSQMNDSAAAQPSVYAKKLMQKMGWKEGQGLGKNETGISKHIVIHKREESSGLGSEKVEAEAIAVQETWWHDAFASNLNKFATKFGKDVSKPKKGRSKSVDSKAGGSSAEPDCTIAAMPSYEELFKATGGARLGMRARADQKGKFKRTESAQLFSTSSPIKHIATSSVVETVAAVTEEKAAQLDSSNSSIDVALKSNKSKSLKKTVDIVEEVIAKKEKTGKKEKTDKKERKEKMEREAKEEEWMMGMKEKKEKKNKKEKKRKLQDASDVESSKRSKRAD